MPGNNIPVRYLQLMRVHKLLPGNNQSLSHNDNGYKQDLYVHEPVGPEIGNAIEFDMTTTVLNENGSCKNIITHDVDQASIKDNKQTMRLQGWFICKSPGTVGSEKLMEKCDKNSSQLKKICVVSGVLSSRVALLFQNFAENMQSFPQDDGSCVTVLESPDIIVMMRFKNADDALEKFTVINSDKELPVLLLSLDSASMNAIIRRIESEIHDKSNNSLIRAYISKGPTEQVFFSTVSLDCLLFKFLCNLEAMTLTKRCLNPHLSTFLTCFKIEEGPRKLSIYLNQLYFIFHKLVQDCPNLKVLDCGEALVGNKRIYINLNQEKLEKSVNNLYGEKKKLNTCDQVEALDLLDYEISQILHSANCDFHDFKCVDDDNEKIALLKSMSYGLLEMDTNLVHVYAACKDGNTTKVILVCYMRENFDLDQEESIGSYRGFETFKKSHSHVCGDMSDVIDDKVYETKLAEYISEDFKEVSKTIEEHTDKLFANHSNLEMIGVSPIKKNDSNHGPYIVFYVRSKSFVPFGEQPFPKELKNSSGLSYQTIVQEDYFVPIADSASVNYVAFTRVPYLAMGCSVGLKDNADGAASVGPFVEFDRDGKSETGFLTACHLFSLSDDDNMGKSMGKQVVQPSEYDDGKIYDDPYQETCLSSVCGIVYANVYDEEVDASLVLVKDRAPDKDRFIYCTPGSLRRAGITGNPVYKDGSSVEINACIGKKMVKFGRTSGITIGRCLTGTTAVNKLSLEVTCPYTHRKSIHIMKNQIQVQGIHHSCFTDSGDSGAGLFLVNENGSLSCVGLVVGKTQREGHGICTPIGTVLQKLRVVLGGKDISLKRFL